MPQGHNAHSMPRSSSVFPWSRGGWPPCCCDRRAAVILAVTAAALQPAVAPAASAAQPTAAIPGPPAASESSTEFHLDELSCRVFLYSQVLSFLKGLWVMNLSLWETSSALKLLYSCLSPELLPGFRYEDLLQDFFFGLPCLQGPSVGLGLYTGSPEPQQVHVSLLSTGVPSRVIPYHLPHDVVWQCLKDWDILKILVKRKKVVSWGRL